MKHPFNVSAWPLAMAAGTLIALTGCGLFDGGSDGAGDAAPAGAEPLAYEGSSESGPDQTVAAAQEAEQAGDLGEARTLYAGAMAEDPNSAEAKEGFKRTSSTLGMAEADEDVVRTAEELTAVRRAQRLVEVESHILAGTAAMNDGDFDAAIQSFEQARNILRWYPDLQGGQFTEESVLARIELAREKKLQRDRAAEQERQLRIQRQQEEQEAEARARAEYRIQTLLTAANQAFQDDRYAEAESYLVEVLKLDPNNSNAARLLDTAKDASKQERDRELRASYKRNWRATFDELTANLRPQTDMVEFPDADQWRSISEQGPIEFSVQDDLVSPEERAIEEKLASVPMRLQFNETSLTEVVNWFKTVTGVNFIVSPAITASGDEPSFTVNAGPMAANEALRLVLEISSTPLRHRIRNGVVEIVGADEAVGGQLLEIYDIRDLAKVITNFPSKDFNLKPSGFSDEGSGVEIPEPQPLVLEGERLAELIKSNIATESWDADPANTIQAVSGALVVRQTREVHELIRDLLRDLRENAGTMINIESRFLTVYDTFLEDIGVDFRGLGPDAVNPDADIPPGLVLDDLGSVPDGFGTPAQPSGAGTDNDVGFFDQSGDTDVRGRVENLFDATLGNDEFTNSGGLSLQATFLDDTLVEAVLRAVSKYGTANIVDAPSLTVYNGQRANLSVINHVSYVKDFDVEIAQAAVIAQPIVDVLQDGVVLDVRPVVSSDKRFITMELRPTVAVLQRPIPTFSTSLAIGSNVNIELPQLNIQRARTTVHMPDGSTLMIGGWKVLEDTDLESGIPFLSKVPILSFFTTRKGKFLEKRKLVVLIRAQIVIPEEQEPVWASAR